MYSTAKQNNFDDTPVSREQYSDFGTTSGSVARCRFFISAPSMLRNFLAIFQYVQKELKFWILNCSLQWSSNTTISVSNLPYGISSFTACVKWHTNVCICLFGGLNNRDQLAFSLCSENLGLQSCAKVLSSSMMEAKFALLLFLTNFGSLDQAVRHKGQKRR